MRLKESINQNQINLLKATYGDIKKINPNSPAVKKLMMALKKLSKDDLETISKAKINFVSTMAQSILRDSNVSESTDIDNLQKRKNDLLKQVDPLIAKKKKLYSDVDITTPKSSDEKKLDKEIADLFSEINDLVHKIVKLKKSQNEGKHTMKLKSVNEAELPKDGSTIKVGNTRVEIKYVGKNKDYVGFNWKGDDGKSNYEETKVSDHKDMNSLINTIKDEIRHQRVVVSKRKTESVNEDVNFRDGKYRFYSKQDVGYLTYDGREISSGDFDWEDGSNSYWMYHSSWRGQKAFDTGKDVIAYFKSKKITTESVNEADLNWNAVQNAIINFLKVNTKILDKKVQAKDTEGVKGGLKSIISGLTNAQRSLNLESVNEASYTVKAENPYQFVNGAYAILNAYLRDEELGPKGKKELQNILKSLDYMRKYFFFKLNESVNEAKYPTDLKIGSVILGQGFTMLKGIDDGRYYKIVDMDDFSATLVPSDKNGNVKGSNKVRHKLDSIEGGIKTAKRGDENGIVVIKESAKKSTFIKVARISNNGKLDIY
jgi:hypothetical protein